MIMKKENEDFQTDEPLDELLSLRGKPFADWKEEREYLRRKWGDQGRKIELEKDQGENPTEGADPEGGDS